MESSTSDSRLLIHARVLFELDANGRIVRVNEIDPENEAPAVFFARGVKSNLVLFRQDVPDWLASEIATLAQRISLWDGVGQDSGVYEPIRSSFAHWQSEFDETHGPAFEFPDSFSTSENESTILDSSDVSVLAKNFPYTQSIFASRSPVAVVLRDEQAVACCFSARKSDVASEAGVATLEQFRGLGFAQATTAAWAEKVRSQALIPLYSTSWSNQGSLKVAKRLGLKAYADTWSVS